MYKLTEAQIQSFHKKGWLGPLDTFSSTEVELVGKQLREISQVKEIEGFEVVSFYNKYMDCYTPRDHHFACESVTKLFADKRIIQRLNQLGKTDLLLWRTNIFHRMPGQAGIGWHQAFDYYGFDVDETKRRDLDFPKDEDILDLVVWVAIEDVTPEIGTLRFANGSYNTRFKIIKTPVDQGTYPEQKYYVSGNQSKSYAKSYDFNEDEWEIETLPEIKAGQIVIFTERVMHSAPANLSQQERFAINGRYIYPRVTVYPDRLAGDYIDNYGRDISNHFCVLVSGKDNFGVNVVKEGKPMNQT
ncbi:MAG: hypothetical protein F6K50_09835 [Moorea sp. SIO3I7]|uniref:phytanoyl-CoA dioxygenase family protein n=1 Tax=unclassified Moorena TaxID=2683338 RepID=UPI0013C0F895|nr:MULTISPECIES: phytanoyl-CoA dioxygenase family protein [unclassified Moorena]NEN95814.1 hypothetical protein [Moorena sp. SIO3I7]NEO09520.1 hypothetical protein [Moorena sp. SIO3I8]NEO23690.1 hypothetical protein [Moorena sp. SIO4A5]NEQ59715.1 hypothetical protein [Moorena sp. SIO4A1]